MAALHGSTCFMAAYASMHSKYKHVQPAISRMHSAHGSTRLIAALSWQHALHGSARFMAARASWQHARHGSKYLQKV